MEERIKKLEKQVENLQGLLIDTYCAMSINQSILLDKNDSGVTEKNHSEIFDKFKEKFNPILSAILNNGVE